MGTQPIRVGSHRGACVLSPATNGCGHRSDPAYFLASTVTLPYSCRRQVLNPSQDREGKFLLFLPLVTEQLEELLAELYRELKKISQADLTVKVVIPGVPRVLPHQRIGGPSHCWRTGPVQHMDDLWLEDRSDR